MKLFEKFEDVKLAILEEYCKENNLEAIMITPGKIELDELSEVSKKMVKVDLEPEGGSLKASKNLSEKNSKGSDEDFEILEDKKNEDKEGEIQLGKRDRGVELSKSDLKDFVFETLPEFIDDLEDEVCGKYLSRDLALSYLKMVQKRIEHFVEKGLK